MISDSPAWTINGTLLNMIDPGSSEKYLGIRIDPWIGISKPQKARKTEQMVKADWAGSIGAVSDSGHLERIYYPTIDLLSRPSRCESHIPTDP